MPAKKQPAKKTIVPTPVPTRNGARKTGDKVLTAKSIKQILEFTGGDENTIVEVSKRSLIALKTAKDKAVAAKALAALDDDNDL